MSLNWQRAGGREWIIPETWECYRNTIRGPEVIARVVRQEGDSWFFVTGMGHCGGMFDGLQAAMDATTKHLDTFADPRPFP